MLYFCVQKNKIKAVKQRSAPPICSFFWGGARHTGSKKANCDAVDYLKLKEDNNQNSKRLLLVAKSYLWLIYSKLYHTHFCHKVFS